ncbi:ABC transporter substrate-binding protein [Shewanella youngdeokensis]|uniref:ABC transporter substrate-binding protein n=1 Tax=Shewanella youngdeokensis TaxID=2999068 RepID=A0ABZ0K3Y4_9GAMM|nr:ABC transporter substrate-binding protein [Shewanella sp. DAU334]
MFVINNSFRPVKRRHSLLLVLILFSASATANCPIPDLTQPPKTVLALNQTSIENMLRLELQQNMVATAYLDDTIPAHLATKMAGIPEIATSWPSREQVMAIKPDLIYAGFPSAFGKSTLGTPQWWKKRDTSVLVNPYTCLKSDSPLVWADAWQDLHQLAKVFNKQAQATELELQALSELPALNSAKKPKVLLLDVYSQQAQIGACCGGADLMIRLAGGDNVGESFEGRWASLSWESVAQQNPDIIVLATYTRNSTSAIEAKLKQHPLLSKINAVKHNRIINIPFTATLASPRIVEGISVLNSVITQWR